MPPIHVDAVPQHIVQPGHNRQPCFFADADYQAYLEWLDDCARRAGHRCATTVVMRWRARVLLSGRTGIWQRNPHLTTRLISASVGD